MEFHQRVLGIIPSSIQTVPREVNSSGATCCTGRKVSGKVPVYFVLDYI